MTDEKHNGWTNRETWAATTWMENDETSVKFFADLATNCNGDTQRLAKEIEDSFQQYWIEAESWNSNVKLMMQDVGSMWRVNWHEIAVRLTGEMILTSWMVTK